MAQVSEVRLPGVGVRHEFTTSGGSRVGVLSRKTGERELLVYDAHDPDRCAATLHLRGDDARTLADLLGATQVSEALNAAQQRVEGLAIDWLALPEGSPVVGSTIGEGKLRTRTGASIVALARGELTIAAPGPEQLLEAGDVIVAVGTPEGISSLRAVLGL